MAPRLHIFLNGEKKEIPAGSSIADLLSSLGFDGKPVLVEHQKRALFPREYSETQLQEGDQVELISVVAGG